ncbi:hypothetical protein NQ117_17485 [Paenibacillus sp. SC116]|uniref:hypothetical protein n=1 Tax=Paenibacillus sp. SC116 TaxID=2968986 RepID=UPI00215AE069|nr:hypothetical protein [Paenibacillus sp. SC116]MCR8845477.1 hypothetical protein [Paenibacillus sp. SC116]
MEQPWIYLVLLGAVIMLVGWKKPARSNNEAQFSENIEATLEHFIHEVGEENEKVLAVVEQLKKENDLRFNAVRHRMDALEATLSQAEERAWHAEQTLIQIRREQSMLPPVGVNMSYTANTITTDSGHMISALEHDIESESASDQPNTAPQSIRTRYEQLFTLVDEGKSNQQIADELQMNRGEVELIRQLSQQESERRV